MSSLTVTDSRVESLRAFIAGSDEPQWLRDVRSRALDRFESLPWPTTQDEEFRRSDVSMYDFDSYSFAVGRTEAAAVENPVGLAGTLTFRGTTATRYSLADGLAEKGVVVTCLADFVARPFPDEVVAAVQDALLAGVANADNRLALWHYVTMTHGAVVYVPTFVEIAEPFLVTMEEDGEDGLRAPQLVVVGAEGARFRVAHRQLGVEDGEVLVNEAVDIVAGDAGEVEYYGFQNINIDSSAISNGLGRVGRDATLHHYNAVFGGLFSKYRFDAQMDGPGADAFLGGVYFPHEDQHVDLRTVQHHVAGQAHSLTLYKGAVTGEAHSVFQGLISVDHDALGTDAYLTNNNLLLGNDGRSDSIPTLQINTDEVRCSHGSTTGTLDELQAFYLMSRGFSFRDARHMLVLGFIDEVVEKFPEVLVDEIHPVVEERITETDD